MAGSRGKRKGELAILRDSLDSDVGSSCLGVVEGGRAYLALLRLTHATWRHYLTRCLNCAGVELVT